MNPGDGEHPPSDPPQVDSTVTREVLYELVWAEPMLKVAARFGVSSSYMARVCTLLNVPRPARGYWAKLAVGKESREELLEIIEMWATPKRLEAFFSDAEHRLEDLPEDERLPTMERLQRARELIGSIDALERFKSWKAPEER